MGLIPEPTNEELRQACEDAIAMCSHGPERPVSRCYLARALLSRLDREAELPDKCPVCGGITGCSNCRLDLAMIQLTEAFQRLIESDRLLKVAREALEKLWKHTPKIDNGYCAVCRGGYVRWHNGKPGPCSDERCLSHVVTRALAEISPAAPEGEKP